MVVAPSIRPTGQSRESIEVELSLERRELALAEVSEIKNKKKRKISIDVAV